ncbi:hypothetical protein AAAC51_16880 [Priestia megaterium]
MFIRQLYDLIELVEADEEAHINDLVSLLKANEHVPFAAIYSMKHLYRKEHEAYIRTCINHVLEKYSNHDYLKLYAAYAFLNLTTVREHLSCYTTQITKSIALLSLS